MKFFPLYLRVLASITCPCLLLLQPQTCTAQSENDEVQFDLVEIDALDLAYDVTKWLSETAPKPSDALHNLVKSRPITITARQAGKNWYIRPPNKRTLISIDAAKFPLNPEDLTSAEHLLDITYLAKWVSVMRTGVYGEGTVDGVDELRKLAEAETEPTKTILLANLGARLSSLSPRNSAWSKAIADNLDAVSKPIAAYRTLENEKVRTAIGFGTEPTVQNQSEIVKVDLEKTMSAWSNFELAIESPNRVPSALSNRIVLWNFNAGHLVANNDQRSRIVKAIALTLVLTPEEHVLFTGDVDNEKLQAIERANSLQQLFETSKQCKLTPFLSRPGSGTLETVESALTWRVGS